MLSDSALLHINFDGAQNAGVFDWGLQVEGDQINALTTLINGSQITFSGNLDPVDVFFDANSNSTFVGYFSSVPEPNSVALLGSLAVGFLIRRRRKNENHEAC